MYYIKEIFKSIQGEGYNAGKPAVFIRFSGCNLWNGKVNEKKNAICKFCDTDFLGLNGVNGGKYDISQLVKKVNLIWENSLSFTEKFVVLTGGEPMLQVNKTLIQKLKESGFRVAIETNGTFEINFHIDWICVSPKENSLFKLKSGDELKVIFPQPKLDLNYLKKLNFKFFFLQPMDGSKKQINTWNVINYCSSHKPWFPSIQLHKTIGIN